MNKYLMVIAVIASSCSIVPDPQPTFDPYGGILQNNKILFHKSSHGGKNDIFKIGPDGKGLENLTESYSISESYPNWSRDGQRIAYTDGLGGIYHTRRDGNDLVKIDITEDGATHPRWSMGGRFITFNTLYRSGGVWFRNSIYDNSSNKEVIPSTLTRYSEEKTFHFPCLSPTSKTVCFIERFPWWGGIQYSLYTANYENPNRGSIYITDVQIKTPKYSPDGKKIVFTQLASAGIFDVYIIDSDGKNLEVLTSGTSDCQDPSFSPDGTQIVYSSNASGNYDLYIINIDGSGKTNITNSSEDEFAPDWN